MTSVELLLRDLDAQWKQHASGTKIRLHLIGCAALLLQTAYNRGTKDGDVLETVELQGANRDRLLALAGEHSVLHKRHRIYIDIVANGVPFLPRSPKYHTVEALAALNHFEVFALDVVDVVCARHQCWPWPQPAVSSGLAP
jgi:hypothetical protein